MTAKSPILNVGSFIADEIQSDAQRAAQRLQIEMSAGMVQQRPSDYVQGVRDHWNDPQFRSDLLTRVGPADSLSTVRAAFGVPPPSRDPVENVLTRAGVPAPSATTPPTGGPIDGQVPTDAIPTEGNGQGADATTPEG